MKNYKLTLEKNGRYVTLEFELEEWNKVINENRAVTLLAEMAHIAETGHGCISYYAESIYENSKSPPRPVYNLLEAFRKFGLPDFVPREDEEQQ